MLNAWDHYVLYGINNIYMCVCVQAAVRAEAHASLEPVRRLPQVLAAALPITDTTLANQVAQAGPLECALSSGET